MGNEKETITEENPFAGFDLLKKPTIEDTTEVKDTKLEDTKVTTPDTTTVDEETAKVQAEAAAKLEAEAKAKEEADKLEAEKLETEAKAAAEKTEKVEEDDSTFLPFIEHLNSKGILDIPEDFEIEDSEDGFETVISKTVESKLDKWKKAYPEDTQRYLQFIEAGGDSKQFFDIFYGDYSWEKVTTDSVEDQKKVIEVYLKDVAGFDDSEIESELADWEDLGKLKAKADTFLPKLQKKEAEGKSKLVETQKQLQEDRQKSIVEYWDTLKNDWFKKEAVKDFKLTPKIKEAVWEHMSKPVDKKTGKTQLQLNNENNPDAQFLYAYLDLVGFDIKKLTRQLETVQAGSLKEKLSKFNQGDSRSTTKKVTKVVSDTQTDEDPFEAFGKLRKKE